MSLDLCELLRKHCYHSSTHTHTFVCVSVHRHRFHFTSHTITLILCLTHSQSLSFFFLSHTHLISERNFVLVDKFSLNFLFFSWKSSTFPCHWFLCLSVYVSVSFICNSLPLSFPLSILLFCMFVLRQCG